MQQNMQRSSISEMRFPFPIFHFILFVENDEENREVNARVHRYFHCLGRNRIKSVHVSTSCFRDRGAIFELRGPNAELPTRRETGWGSEFTGLRQQQ